MNRGDRLRQGQAMLRFKPETAYFRSSRSDLSLAMNSASVVQLGNQPYVTYGRRINVAFAGEHLGRQTHRFDKIAGNVCEGREKKISEAMTSQVARPAKAIAKQSREEV